MTRKETDKYVELLLEDERDYSVFLTHSAFALIGANWVLVQSTTSPTTVTVTGSLLAAVGYLFIRALRHRLKMAHCREILEREREKKDSLTYSTKKAVAIVQSAYNKMSHTISHFELPLLATSGGLFVASAIAIITKHLA